MYFIFVKICVYIYMQCFIHTIYIYIYMISYKPYNIYIYNAIYIYKDRKKERKKKRKKEGKKER